ncbi:hypothetical protein FRB94_000673 [Tulasnella sp. JGI-2019a]|nr:hypothetical protein FRB94_000673 [Tulasnella sp. JGI-2019a]
MEAHQDQTTYDDWMDHHHSLLFDGLQSGRVIFASDRFISRRESLTPDKGQNRSRSLRIVLIPACLLALNAVGFATIVVVNFILARRPNNTQLLAINYPLFVTVQSVVVAYTSYITVFIAIRLWWVGRAADRAILFETPRGNRYAGAISALIQSGVMQSATRIITICIAVGVNYSLVPTVGRIAVPINGISATLLFLQLDMFQQQKRDSDTPTLSTGVTVKFAGQEGSSDGPFAPVARRQRRASTSILYQRHESFNDTGEMHLSSPIHVASTQHSARLSPSDHSATTTILPNKLEGKEVV